MHKLNNTILMFFITLVSFLIIPMLNVDAYGAKTTIVASRTEIVPGEDLTLTLKIKELDNISRGINAYMGIIDYDESLFEPIMESDFKVLNSWENLKYNPNNKQFILIKRLGTTKDEGIVKITLHSKGSIKDKDTYVQVHDFSMSEGKLDINKTSEVKTLINILSSSNELKPEDVKEEIIVGTNKPSTIKNNKGVSTITPVKNNKNVTSKGKQSKNKTTSTTKKEITTKVTKKKKSEEKVLTTKKIKKEYVAKVKNRRLNLWLTILLLIIILLLLIIIKRMRDEKPYRNYVFVLILLLITSPIAGIVLAVGEKGEINGDGYVDYQDIDLLEKYLIKLSPINDSFLVNADMNSDGAISITDLSLLLNKLENKIDYKANVKDIVLSNLTPKKNEEIEISFRADISYGAKATNVIINGKSYNLRLENNLYKTSFKVPNESGIFTLKFEELLLDVYKSVDINKQVNFEVLKSKPFITGYKLIENIDESEISVEFEVNDLDLSISDSKITIYDSLNAKVLDKNMEIGYNLFTFSANPKELYSINICLEYFLDSNKGEKYKSSIELMEKAVLTGEYNLDFNNLKILNKKMIETNIFAKDEIATIMFNATNDYNIPVKYLKIDSKIYEVSQDQDSYKVEFMPDVKGNNTYKVNSVILTNGKEIILTDNTFDLVLTKTLPATSGIRYEEVDDKLVLSTSIIDLDNSLSKASILVFDYLNNQIFEKSINGSDENVFEIDTSSINTKAYYVKVVADYNVTNRLETNQELTSISINANLKADIKAVIPNKEYVNKLEEFKVVYEIETNQDESITSMTLNNLVLTPNKIGNNLYEVTFIAPDKAGLLELDLTKITVNDKVLFVSNKTNIEVLKTAYKIDDYHIIEDNDFDKITTVFDVNDLDNSFIGGKIVLQDSVTKNIVKEYRIEHALENSFTFDVTINKLYNVFIYADYAKDIKKEKYITTNELLLTKQLILIKDYNLSINNESLKNKDGVATSYFNKGEKVSLEFSSVNNTAFYPEKIVINNKEYALIKNNNNYQVSLEVSKESGVHDFNIESVTLSNGKKLDISNKKITYEVLKDKATISNFSYKDIDNEITLDIKIDDIDSAIKNKRVIVRDQSNNVLLDKTSLDKLSFRKNTSKEYIVKIIVDYDLDTNTLTTNDHFYQNINLLTETIKVIDNSKQASNKPTKNTNILNLGKRIRIFFNK